MLRLENWTSDINLHSSVILAFENPSDNCWGYQKTRISIYDPYFSLTILMLTFASVASTKTRELLALTTDDWLTTLTRHQISDSWEACVIHSQSPHVWAYDLCDYATVYPGHCFRAGGKQDFIEVLAGCIYEPGGVRGAEFLRVYEPYSCFDRR